MKTLKELALAGECLNAYGKQYMLNVTLDAIDINRTRWSMVPLNNGGKNAVDFYLQLPQMILLCKEITSGIAEKKILADANSQYPSAYKFVTGENGEKKLNIGGGKVGVRIQCQDAGKNLRYMMAVSMEDLKMMAVNFQLFTGLTPVGANTYFGSLVEEFNKGREQRKKFHVSLSKSDMETPEQDAAPAEQKPAEKAPEKKSEPVKAQEKKQEAKAEPKPEPKKPAQEATAPEERKYTLNIAGPVKDANGYYQFNCKEDDKAYYLLFKKDEADELTWFEQFRKKAESLDGAKMPVIAERRSAKQGDTDFLIYKGVAR